LSQFKNAAGVVTTSYHATLASLYDGIPVVSIYENEYYGFKYRGLQEVLDTPLLHAVNLADYEINELHRTLDSKDRDIRARINKLKKVNRQAYKKYRDFLRVL
jgi:polysaccharide pyruvyl transferase WcaK-like protein